MILFVFEVADENDNAPWMSNEIYFVTFHENNALNARIIRMNATDIDSGKNGVIQFRLEALDGTPRESAVIDAVIETRLFH